MVTGRKSVNKGAAETADKQTAATAAKPKRSPGKTTTRRAPQKKAVADKPQPAVPASDVIDLGDALVISNVLEWHGKLSNRFTAKGKLTLDGSNIEQIDATGLQLLTTLIKQAGSQDMTVVWKGTSETLRASAAQLGLFGALHLDAAAD